MSSAQVSFLETSSGVELHYMSHELGLYRHVYNDFLVATQNALRMGLLSQAEAATVLRGNLQIFDWTKQVPMHGLNWLLNNGFRYVGGGHARRS